MTHKAKILADSMSPDGVRLTTLEVTFPRIVLAEINTHRMFSRNSASSRAIPVEKMIRMVQENPYVPTHWGKNQKGMQADEEVQGRDKEMAEKLWLEARDEAADKAELLRELCGIHKQITNRLLEPFMWHTAIITATEWDNFFHLRCHKDAHPELRLAAELMQDAMGKSEPIRRLYALENTAWGNWHLPLIREEDYQEVKHSYSTNETHCRHCGLFEDDEDNELCWDSLCKVSIGRCARVSYLTHDGKRDWQADIELCERLLASWHMSPFEHVARPMTKMERKIFKQPVLICDEKTQGWQHVFYVDGQRKYTHFLGNFNGWVQYRKLIPHEQDILR